MAFVAANQLSFREAPYSTVVPSTTIQDHRVKYEHIYNAIPELAAMGTLSLRTDSSLELNRELHADPLVAEHLLVAYARTHSNEIMSLYRARISNSIMGMYGRSHTDIHDSGTGIATIPSPSNLYHIDMSIIPVASSIISSLNIEDVD